MNLLSCMSFENASLIKELQHIECQQPELTWKCELDLHPVRSMEGYMHQHKANDFIEGTLNNKLIHALLITKIYLCDGMLLTWPVQV